MAPQANALHANLDVDYVITYRFHDTREPILLFHMATLMTALHSQDGGVERFPESGASSRQSRVDD